MIRRSPNAPIMSGRVKTVNWIVLTIEIRLLIEVSVPGDEPTDLGIVRSRSDVQEAGIAPVLVARGA